MTNLTQRKRIVDNRDTGPCEIQKHGAQARKPQMSDCH